MIVPRFATAFQAVTALLFTVAAFFDRRWRLFALLLFFPLFALALVAVSAGLEDQRVSHHTRR